MFTSANYQKEIQSNRLDMQIEMQENRQLDMQMIVMLCFALFCALFGGIYERFSHEVYSYYMIYAFAIPLAGSLLPLMIRAQRGKSRADMTSIRLWNYGIVTLTVGSLARGALDIYGTTNPLLMVYPAVALLFCLSSLVIRRRHQRAACEST